MRSKDVLPLCHCIADGYCVWIKRRVHCITFLNLAKYHHQHKITARLCVQNGRFANPSAARDECCDARLLADSLHDSVFRQCGESTSGFLPWRRECTLIQMVVSSRCIDWCCCTGSPVFSNFSFSIYIRSSLFEALIYTAVTLVFFSNLFG